MSERGWTEWSYEYVDDEFVPVAPKDPLRCLWVAELSGERVPLSLAVDLTATGEGLWDSAWKRTNDLSLMVSLVADHGVTLRRTKMWSEIDRVVRRASDEVCVETQRDLLSDEVWLRVQNEAERTRVVVRLGFFALMRAARGSGEVLLVRRARALIAAPDACAVVRSYLPRCPYQGTV